MSKFVHLHLHSEYSLLDGATRLSKLFKRCKELGMDAVAITDHGNMYGALKFDQAAVNLTNGSKMDATKFASAYKEYAVKPIYGCEFYVAKDMCNKTAESKNYHLVLLAKDATGYHNMAKLNSIAYREGFYYKPRIDRTLLRRYSEGIVGLSACLAGEIPQALLRNDYDEAVRIALDYKSIFADGDFYIEIQRHNIAEQEQILPSLIRLALETGLKLVATNDVHYLNREDSESQKVLQCISYKTTFDDFSADEGDYFPTDEFYLKSYDEMESLFRQWPEALASTVEIADKCNYLMEYKKKLLPNYTPPEGLSSKEYLRKLTYDGLRTKYSDVSPLHTARAELELRTIEKNGFVDYFLIVWDFIHYSESIGVPVGPGRGSGVGSIVAYATGITKVDPIKHDLFFERFLNDERVSMPDFDIDFCIDGRPDVIKYVVNKYGAANVSQIITFGTLATKSAIKDVGRVLGVDYATTDKITKAMPMMVDKDARLLMIAGQESSKPRENGEQTNFLIPEIRDMYDSDPKIKRVIDMAAKIEGMPRNPGMHPAGVVICCDPIADHVPLQTNREDVTTQFDKKEVEKIGLLKMDFLGLRTLTDIKKALQYIKENKGIDIDFYSMEYDDPKVFELVGSGNTHGVFQLESSGMKSFMRRLKPEHLEDIIAGISLFRPGPMRSIDAYIAQKNGLQPIVYETPLLEPILNISHGILVYQEQVMRIFQDIAGYSLGMADIIRRLMGDKDTAQMAKEKVVFLYGDEKRKVDGALKRGVTPAAAERLWEKIADFAEYAFNKSHATAYAYLSYQTAYLCVYHRIEFMAAILNNRISHIEEISNYLSYLKDCKIDVLPPDINKSGKDFMPLVDAVRVGLNAIKNVGTKAIEQIIEERRNGEFRDFEDFLNRSEGLNRKMLESLILSGAFDCFRKPRACLFAVSEYALDVVTAARKQRVSGQLSLFDMLAEQGAEVQRIQYPRIAEYDESVKLKLEKEVLGIYISGHPLKRYDNALKAVSHNTLMLTAASEGEDGAVTYENATDRMRVQLGGILSDIRKRTNKRTGAESKTGKLEDLYGIIEVNLSEKVYAQYKDLFVDDSVVQIDGSLSLREGERPSVWVNQLIPLSGATERGNSATTIYIRMNLSDERLNNKLISILSNYPGNAGVRVQDSDSKAVYPLDIRVQASETLRKELVGLCGYDNVKTVGNINRE